MLPEPITMEAIRRAAGAGRWALTRHARERAGRRRIGGDALVQALAAGEILESYPKDERGPSALALGHTADGRAIHAVCAFDPAGTLLVVTVYEPMPPKWIDERTRNPRQTPEEGSRRW